ncbi:MULTISPECIES: HlyD family secretion protein [Rahnella]|uniref:HlyD family secretion protein n=1 Tax=Rahnella laticis TaxID=2787622 RepID=A0ABS0E4Q5_9GAMM|nr:MULTISPECIES: HlyD family secretion protein [Rahnella]MBF7979699.1 HlyD family secretion protein [Rahnella laticis]MBF7999789.1 HlyD family secretion protein [Rahnella sp. LAC-M12]
MIKTSPVRLSWLVAAVVVVLLIVIAFWMLSTGSAPETDDAFVSADSTLVAPRISGTIADVYVQDNQSVKAGDVLAKIDDRDYRNAVLTAQASLETANAQMLSLTAQLAKQQQTILQAQAMVNADSASIAYARQSADRYKRLLQNGSGTADARDESDANLRSKLASQQSDMAAAQAAEKQVDVLKAEQAQAKAAIDSAATALAQAKLNLSYTEITAPVDGVVGQRSLRIGGYVSAGTRVLAVVPLHDAYIVANYLETQLGDVQQNQQVDIKIDALPGVTLKGKVDSISPATGVTFSPISPDNATGNYTKVVQRLAVKIVLDKDQADAKRLKVGMSVIPTINTASR